MRPGSLLGILLELIEELGRPGPLPADARIGRFFRSRRYLGARDRRAIAGPAYGWLRHQDRGEARWDAWAARTGLPQVRSLTGRPAPLATLLALAGDGLLGWSWGEVLAAARDLAPPLPSFWEPILARVSAEDRIDPAAWPEDPLERLAAELSLPPWLARRLVDERGEAEARSLGATLLIEAGVDLRVNTAAATREEAAAEIERELGPGTIHPTPWSPLGLRLESRRNLGRFMTAHPGWIEVQDEGSQLAVLCAGPQPGETVIDACAGAGGKTLAVLDLLGAAGGGGTAAGRRGKVHACDVRPEKLEELLRRAGEGKGSPGLAVHPISPEGPLPASLPAEADLVLVDAPCSGTGTLRRAPELKHRYGPEDIARFAELQGAILRRFAHRVRRGGRLVYTTCSLLHEENGAVVEGFLREEQGFEEVHSAWAETHLPPAARRGARVHLDPLATGTDGFFVAVLRRLPG